MITNLSFLHVVGRNPLFICVFFAFSACPPARGFDYFPGGATAGLPLEALSAYAGSARGAGTGGAGTAQSGSAACSYWNPAGISGIAFNEINVTNSILLGGTQLVSASFAYPAGGPEGYILGLNISRLASGEAERTDSTGFSLGYTFSEVLTSTIFTFSKKVSPGFYSGLNFKVINQSMDTYSAQGQSFDAGIIYHYNPETSYGLALENITQFQLGTDTAGRNLKAGLKNTFLKDKLIGYMDITALDIMNPGYTAVIRWGLGMEYRVTGGFWLRSGANSREVSLGFGISGEKINFDYAVSAHPLDFTHRFSVNARYGFLPDEKELKIREQQETLSLERQKYAQEKSIQKEQLKEEQRKLKLENWVHAKMVIAEDFFRNNKYGPAEEVLKEIIDRDSNNEAARELMKELNKRTQVNYIAQKYVEAVDLYKQGRYPGSLEAANTVVSLDQSHNGARVIAFLSQAQMFLLDQKYEDAKSELMELLKIDSNNNEALTLLKRIQAIVDIMGAK